MKQTFKVLMNNNGTMTAQTFEGDYDGCYLVFYDKTSEGWRATDQYSGRALTLGKSTKKECQEAVKEIIDKFKEVRKGEKYLQSVINFKELCGD